MIQNKRSISADSLESLREKISCVLKRKIETHCDCEFLADNILKVTGRRIGITTIRRFYGLDPASSLPSAYTLDTFSLYCGYESWYLFNDTVTSNIDYSQQTSKNIPEASEWESVAKNAESISLLTFKALKHKVGIAWEDAVERKFATKHIVNFLNSDKTATAFIAPGGYGKSTLLAKSVESLWLGENPLFPDDIVWFIDAGILNGLLSKGFDLSQWIAAQLGMDQSQNYREYFRNNPDKLKGRLILIIDALEEIISRSDKDNDLINPLISLIASNESTPWFKIILSMRNFTWNKFVSTLNDYPFLLSSWYGVAFRVYKEESTNIPPFNFEEIQSIIDNIGKRLPEDIYNSLKQITISGDFNHIISYPYFLQLFIYMIQEKGTAPESDTELFVEFMKTKICTGPLGEEKHLIVQSFQKEIELGLKGDTVNKNRLLKDIYVKNNLKAYQELLSFGILREEVCFTVYGAAETFIRFSHKILQDFMIAAYYAQKSDRITITTFETVLKRYENSELKLDILTWLIKLAFHQKEYDVIFKLKNILNQDIYIKKFEFDRKVDEFWQVIKTIGTSLRYNSQARAELIPRFAADREWQEWYFENFVDIDYLVPHFGKSLWYYLLYKRTPESVLFGHTLLLYKDLIEMNYEEAGKQVKIIESVPHDPETIHPILLGRSIGFRIMYYFLVNNKINEELIKTALDIEEKLSVYSKNPDYVPTYHATVMAGLNFVQKYDITIMFWEKIQEKYTEIMNKIRIPEVELAKITVADAWLSIGEVEKCEEMLKTYSGNFYNTTRNSYNIIYNVIQAKISLLKGKKGEAYKLLGEALISSKQFGNKLFEKAIKVTFKEILNV